MKRKTIHVHKSSNRRQTKTEGIEEISSQNSDTRLNDFEKLEANHPATHACSEDIRA